MDRREFLKQSTAAMAVLAASSEAFASGKEPEHFARRPLGSTGERVSIVGFPGTALMSEEQSVANNIVAEAFDRGINFYDVSPTYGNAQEKMGLALEPFRQRSFLASKTDMRDKAGVEKELEETLKILRTDHVDLFQHHAVEPEDYKKIIAPGGAMEAFVAAQKAGKIRFFGLSTHHVEVALDAIEHMRLDTMMFPVNFVLYTKAGFGPQVVEKARARKMGVIAIKAMARGKYAANLAPEKRIPKCWYEPATLPEEAGLALRWTLGQDVDAAIPSGNHQYLRLAMETVKPFKGLSAEENKKLMAFAEGADPLFTLAKK